MAEKVLLRLKQGESYLWLFAVYAALFMAASLAFMATGDTRNFFWPAITLHAGTLYLAASEIRSKVALDSWWVATYPQGTWQYRALVAWHLVATLLCLIAAVIALAY